MIALRFLWGETFDPNTRKTRTKAIPFNEANPFSETAADENAFATPIIFSA